MNVRTLIHKLMEYNLDAEVGVVAHNKIEKFSITYSGDGEGETKQTSDMVNFYVDSLCSSESHIVNTNIDPVINPIVMVIEFDDLVEHGRNWPGVNIVEGMPWSFEYKGHPITHDNDECYLIPGNGSIITQFFRPGDLLITDLNNNLHVIEKGKNGKGK